MSSFSFLQPRNNDNVEKIIQHIGSQSQRSNDTPFHVDEGVATLARQLFQKNFQKNQIISKAASFLGIVGAVGVVGSAVTAFYSFRYALGAVALSAVCLKSYISLRNPEGYRLQEALKSASQDEQIRQLSLGANIYQSIWPFGGAAPGLGHIVKGGPRTLCARLASAGKYETLAYALMLEEDPTKRAELATQAIPESKDVKTAELLLDFGAKMENGRTLFFCCLRKDLELANFFVRKGAALDSGISDYQKWQSDLDPREREFGGNWFSPNNDGVSPTLHPDFRTPLERLVEPDKGPSGSIHSPTTENPVLAFEALGIDPAAYINKETAEALFHSLNKNGVRLRKQWAEIIFNKLN